MIEITKATKKDSEKILEYYLVLCRQQTRFRSYCRPAKNLVKVCKRIVSKMFAKNKFVYKAVAEGKTAGFVSAEVKIWPENEGKDFYVHSLFVDPAFRGRGIGTKLLQKMIKLARLKKIKWISLSTDVKNKCAKSLYEKMGFETHRIVLKKRV